MRPRPPRLVLLAWAALALAACNAIPINIPHSQDGVAGGGDAAHNMALEAGAEDGARDPGDALPDGTWTADEMPIPPPADGALDGPPADATFDGPPTDGALDGTTTDSGRPDSTSDAESPDGEG